MFFVCAAPWLSVVFLHHSTAWQVEVAYPVGDDGLLTCFGFAACFGGGVRFLLYYNKAVSSEQMYAVPFYFSCLMLADEEDARSGFERSTAEALSSFGDARMLVEKYIEDGHHIEIQARERHTLFRSLVVWFVVRWVG